MSLISRSFNRSRASLLATSMFATTALAGFGGVVGAIVLTPGAALAQCTTAPGAPPATAAVGPATETCVGSFPTGIGYSETTVGGNLSVNLNGPGTVAGGGVLLNDTGGGAANLTLVLGNATNAGQNIVTTQGSNAVTVHSTGGNVAIITGNAIPGEVITGNIAGIDARTTGAGTVNVITIANVTGLASNGIFTSTVNGNNTVSVGGNVVAGAGSGVRSIATGSGAVLVTLGNTTTTAGNVTTVTPYSVTDKGGNGVLAEQLGGVGNRTAMIVSTDAGNVTVNNAASGSVGVAAVSFGSGAGSVASVNMTGAPGGAVSVQGNGTTFNVGIGALAPAGTATVTTNTGRTVNVDKLGGTLAIGVGTIGNVAVSTLGDSNTINIGGGNTTTSDSAGVLALGIASATVNTGNSTTINVTGNNTLAGIVALGSTASVNAGNGASINVTGSTALTGVLADATAGNATVNIGNTAANTTGITVVGNTTLADNTGITAEALGGNATADNVSIKIGSTAIKVTGGDGIFADASGGVGVTTAGNVNSTTGVAINTRAGGNTAISVNGGTTSGIGNATLPSVQFLNRTANTTTTVNIGAAGTVATDLVGNATTPSLTGLAIAPAPGNVTIGSVVVNDAGHLIGDVDFSRVIGTGFAGNATVPANISNTTVNVTGNGVWLTSGTSKFGNGALGAGNATVASDTVTTGGPGGNGLIQTVGATTFQFGTTTKNSYTNVGTTQVGSDGAPSTFTLTGGPIVLANAGVIDLSTGVVGTDALTGLTTVFVGVAGGQIATKAQLGGVG
ncbi:MAG TPA: hypothetical protein VGL73_11095, partial [Caulobacteraceae bacterium]